jgi:8-oxo-(d)GTP phosphatase
VSEHQVVRAAGGIVVRADGGAEQVLLVHRPKYDDWSFPKGKLNEGEREEEAALREVEEETGLRCRLDRHVGAVTYTDRTGRPKIVRYWMMSALDGTFTPGDEVDTVRWLTAPKALEVLTYVHDRDLLEKVFASTATAPLYVVRHAKAGDRAKWRGPDRERPLTRRGRRQADRLVERFRGLEISRIVSSPFVRCVQTVEPIAARRGLAVETADELAEGADVEAATGFVGSLNARPTLLCGHGGEIEGVIEAFRSSGANLEGIGGLAKGSVWVLERRDGDVVSARYLPAPPG